MEGRPVGHSFERGTSKNPSIAKFCKNMFRVLRGDVESIFFIFSETDQLKVDCPVNIGHNFHRGQTKYHSGQPWLTLATSQTHLFQRTNLGR